MEEKSFYSLTWNYFQQHANQRIELINFYIILEVFLFTGMYTVAISEDADANIQRVVCIIIGIASICFSFIFYNLDCRTKRMIKNSERILKAFEAKYSAQFGDELMVFSSEEQQTNTQRRFTIFPLSYANCFRFLFLFFSGIGVISIAYFYLAK